MEALTREQFRSRFKHWVERNNFPNIHIRVNEEGQPISITIGDTLLFSYRYGSWGFSEQLKFATTTARSKLASCNTFSGLAQSGTVAYNNIDFLYHYVNDFQDLTEYDKIRERIVDPYFSGLYATTVAVNNYITQHNLTKTRIKALLKGSKWRWIKLETGQYIQQTLYCSISYSGERHNVNSENLFFQGSNYHPRSFNVFVQERLEEYTERVRENHERARLERENRLYDHQYRATELFSFKQGKNPKYTTFMGVEVELENHSANELPTLRTLKEHAILKRDGSLTNGVEICTAPATLDVHLQEFKSFFDAHKENKSKLEAKDTCGLHIHVDKSKLSALHIANISLFMNSINNNDEIERIAGRKGNRYCARTNVQYYNFVVGGQRDRYQRVNLTNQDTIEFRLFSSTTDYLDFAKKLEFTQAVVDYTRPGATKYSCKEVLAWENFMEYVKSNKQFYPNFIKGLTNESQSIAAQPAA